VLDRGTGVIQKIDLVLIFPEVPQCLYESIFALDVDIFGLGSSNFQKELFSGGGLRLSKRAEGKNRNDRDNR